MRPKGLIPCVAGLASLVALALACGPAEDGGQGNLGSESGRAEASGIDHASIARTPRLDARVDRAYAAIRATLEEAGYALQPLTLATLNERGQLSMKVLAPEEHANVMLEALAGDGDVAYVSEALAEHPEGQRIRIELTPADGDTSAATFEVGTDEVGDPDEAIGRLNDQIRAVEPLIEVVEERLRTDGAAARED